MPAALLNPDAVCAEVWQRARRAAVHSTALRAIADELRPQLPRRLTSPAL